MEIPETLSVVMNAFQFYVNYIKINYSFMNS